MTPFDQALSPALELVAALEEDLGRVVRHLHVDSSHFGCGMGLASLVCLALLGLTSCRHYEDARHDRGWLEFVSDEPNKLALPCSASERDVPMSLRGALPPRERLRPCPLASVGPLLLRREQHEA